MKIKERILAIKISLTIFLAILLCFLLVIKFIWLGADGKGYTGIIDSDGKGYYMYLPNIFINKNIKHQVVDNRYVFQFSKGTVNKYYVGTAVAMLPFFGTGYLIAYLKNYELNGYSAPFQKIISFAALFYLFLGLIFFKKFLELYNISSATIITSILLLVFGTNLLAYTIVQPAFSHIYSFCFISLFLFSTKNSFLYKDVKSFFLSSFALGMIILIRPVNVLIILTIPFLAGTYHNLKNIFGFLRGRDVLFVSLILGFTLSIQILVWYIQAKEFFVWNYKDEGFYFLNPQIWNVLFSFRKGLFIYSPLVFLSLFGFYKLAKRGQFEFYSLIIFFFLLVYIISCWWNWYYSSSFGQRTFVEFYPLVGLLIAFFLDGIKGVYKKLIYSVGIVLVVLNLIQTYQYTINIMSSWDMNFEKYKYIFLKTSPQYIGCLGGNNDVQSYSNRKDLILYSRNDYEKEYKYWNTEYKKIITQNNVCDYTDREFNTGLKITADSSIAANRLLYAEVKLDRLELTENASSRAFFVIDLSTADNKNYHYYTFRINEVPSKVTNKWRTFKYFIEIPKIRSTDDIIKIYIWNRDKQAFYIDNFQIKLFGLN